MTQTAIAQLPMKPKTIYDLAREALEETGGLTDPAISILKQMIADNEDLREALATDAINSLVETRVQTVMRSERKNVWNAAVERLRPAQPSGGATKPKTSPFALGNAVTASLMNFSLTGGLRLRDATREDIEVSAQRYESMSQNMAHKARWLRAIAARLEPEATVGDCLDDATVTALHEETANA